LTKPLATSSKNNYQILTTAQFNKDVRSLGHQVQVQLVKKLKEIESHPDPISLATPLTNFAHGQFRWRIGSYRIIFDVEDRTIYLLSVRHRSEVYK
jgi:mRNA interferase RelE/StbE